MAQDEIKKIIVETLSTGDDPSIKFDKLDKKINQAAQSLRKFLNLQEKIGTIGVNLSSLDESINGFPSNFSGINIAPGISSSKTLNSKVKESIEIQQKQLNRYKSQYEQLMPQFLGPIAGSQQFNRLGLTPEELLSVKNGPLPLTQYNYKKVSSQSQKELEQQYRLGNIGFNTYISESEKYNQNLKQIQKNIKETSDMMTTSSEKSGKSFMDQIKKMSTWALGWNLIYGAIRVVENGIRETIDLNLKFNDSIETMSALTGKSVNEISSGFMRGMQIASEFGKSFKYVSESMELWIRQGRSVEDTLYLMRQEMLLTTLTTIKESEANHVLTAIMAEFNISARESGKITDVLFNLSRKYAISAEELGEGIKTVGPIAHEFGLSFEKTAAIITEVTATTRLNSTTIATALRTIFSRVRRPEVIKDLQDMAGVVSYTSTGYASLGSVFEQLNEKWKNLNEVQRVKIAQDVAGVRQVSQFEAMMKNFTTAIQANNVALNSAGTAEIAMIEKSNSLKIKLGDLLNEFQQIGIELGKAPFQKSIEGIVTFGLQVASLIKLLAPVIGYTISWAIELGKFVGIFYLLKTVIPLVVIGYSSLTAAIKSFTVANLTLIDVLSTEIPLMGSLAAIGAVWMIGTEIGQNIKANSDKAEIIKQEKIYQASRGLGLIKDHLNELYKTGKNIEEIDFFKKSLISYSKGQSAQSQLREIFKNDQKSLDIFNEQINRGNYKVGSITPKGMTNKSEITNVHFLEQQAIEGARAYSEAYGKMTSEPKEKLESFIVEFFNSTLKVKQALIVEEEQLKVITKSRQDYNDSLKAGLGIYPTIGKEVETLTSQYNRNKIALKSLTDENIKNLTQINDYKNKIIKYLQNIKDENVTIIENGQVEKLEKFISGFKEGTISLDSLKNALDSVNKSSELLNTAGETESALSSGSMKKIVLEQENSSIQELAKFIELNEKYSEQINKIKEEMLVELRGLSDYTYQNSIYLLELDKATGKHKDFENQLEMIGLTMKKEGGTWQDVTNHMLTGADVLNSKITKLVDTFKLQLVQNLGNIVKDTANIFTNEFDKAFDSTERGGVALNNSLRGILTDISKTIRKQLVDNFVDITIKPLLEKIAPAQFGLAHPEEYATILHTTGVSVAEIWKNALYSGGDYMFSSIRSGFGYSNTSPGSQIDSSSVKNSAISIGLKNAVDNFEPIHATMSTQDQQNMISDSQGGFFKKLGNFTGSSTFNKIVPALALAAGNSMYPNSYAQEGGAVGALIGSIWGQSGVGSILGTAIGSAFKKDSPIVQALQRMSDILSTSHTELNVVNRNLVAMRQAIQPLGIRSSYYFRPGAYTGGSTSIVINTKVSAKEIASALSEHLTTGSFSALRSI